MNEFKIISYNIWFDKTLYLERLISLIQTINDCDPDVICLQEVRPEVFELLIVELQNYEYYYPKKINREYGCVTFSKYKIEKCLESEFQNSLMGRSLIITKINYQLKPELTDKIDIVVGNSHYESLFKKNMINSAKIKQYEETNLLMEALYKTFKNVILCADTNVLSHEEIKFKEQFEDNKWLDSWKEKGDKLNEFTYDSVNNIYLKIKLKNKYESRIDRILFKGESLKLYSFSILKGGKNCIEPSDHFGVLSKFEIKNEINNNPE